jgi:hypothetical protein
LNVDPGGYSSEIARESIGLSGALVRRFHAAVTFCVSWAASSLGS